MRLRLGAAFTECEQGKRRTFNTRKLIVEFLDRNENNNSVKKGTCDYYHKYRHRLQCHL